MKSERLARLIDSAQCIAVCGHVNPDGDAVGSALAFAAGLRQMKKEADVLLPGPIDPVYLFLPGADRILMPEDAGEKPYDLTVCLACSDAGRLGDLAPLLQGRPCAVIDHHITNDCEADYVYVDAQASATGEILTELLPQLGITVDRTIAEYLLVAIEMDTGGFAHRNTTPRTLRAAADLVACGADINAIYTRLYASRRLSKTKLMGRAIEHIRTECSGAVVTTYLTKQDFEVSGATEVDSDGVIDILREIDTCRLCALLRESQDGCKVSFRCAAGYDVAAVAKELGGGGHVLASGCTVREDIDAAEAMIRERLVRAWREGKTD